MKAKYFLIASLIILISCSKDNDATPNQNNNNNNNNNNNSNNNLVIDKTKIVGWWYPDQRMINGVGLADRVFFGADSTCTYDYTSWGIPTGHGRWVWLNDSTVTTTFSQTIQQLHVKRLTVDSFWLYQGAMTSMIKCHR